MTTRYFYVGYEIYSSGALNSVGDMSFSSNGMPSLERVKELIRSDDKIKIYIRYLHEFKDKYDYLCWTKTSERKQIDGTLLV